VKRRWKVLLGAGGLVLALALVPIVTIETRCRSPVEGLETTGYKPAITDKAWQRDESRTWLTYPEWHIVYSAESFGAFLARGNPPSGYHYLRDIRGFWSGYCAMNQAAAGRADTDARVMLYTIGLSYSAELLVKALYENTLGRIGELGGWNSADDRYAARVQQRYGAFMHETPWYEFPFGEAFSGLWKTSEPHHKFRHWERRIALSGEYGVKTGYAKFIGWASGASLGRDERTLRFVIRGNGKAIAAVDPRFRVIGPAGKDLTLVEAPRYEEFTDLLSKLARTPIELVEISGNDDIYLTLLMPPGKEAPGPAVHLLTTPLDDPPSWQRIGISTKVPDLLRIMNLTRQSGVRVEHVYDY
jgi:hypothetical protein